MAEAAEIEITVDMVVAGAMVLADYDPDDEPISEAALRIFAAMLGAEKLPFSCTIPNVCSSVQRRIAQS